MPDSYHILPSKAATSAANPLRNQGKDIPQTMSATSRHVMDELPPGRVATIRIKRREPIEVTLEHEE